MNLLSSVARFNADQNWSNFNCNRHVDNSKSKKDEIPALGITRVNPKFSMKTYKNLYPKIYSKKNLILAFKKARQDKTAKEYVIKFENNLEDEINKLQEELKSLTYKPTNLRRFIIRDPKTRTIHSSIFRDRIIHHAIVNVLEPIYEKIFIFDSYASRINKGVHKAVKRLGQFKLKVSKNHQLIKNNITNNQIKGYFLKADIKKYFDSVDHKILLNILKNKIKDDKFLGLIKLILDNFKTKTNGKGMPLGNLTSQFFANVYLNELDYFIKHNLMVKYYIRYVDDFVILHNDKQVLGCYKKKIGIFLQDLNLNLHPDKSSIKPLKNGVAFLGYRVYGKYTLLRKSNIRNFERNLNQKLSSLKKEEINHRNFIESIRGWLGYAKHADTFNLRRSIIKKITKHQQLQ